MFDTLVALTGILCVGAMIHGYYKYRDPFHPLVLMLPMCAFVYAIMPFWLSRDGALFSYVSEAQCVWVQSVILAGLISLIVGLHAGSLVKVRPLSPNRFAHADVGRLNRGAFVTGALGVLAWLYTINNVGGVTEVFGRAKGMGWSEYGFIRDAAYLMIVALLLLFSPQGLQPKSLLWRLAVVVFSVPYLLQGLLGAQRGPTFLIVTTIGMSHYLARNKRPSLPLVLAAGVSLGFLMLFLVTNRGSIYIGSESELTADVSGVLEASEANEYIFGAGCMIAADETGKFFWGKRYLAQVFVRPIPRQIWPTKYEDFGVPELLQNAGVAGNSLLSVMGWQEIPGAAAAMIADLWVEASWLALPLLFIVGYCFASAWRKAIVRSGPYATQFMILVLLSVYFVSQSGEAVIYRLFILSVPVWYVWRTACPPPHNFFGH